VPRTVPKYLAALDSCRLETRQALPLFRRLGEIMYSGPGEVSELSALSAVLSLIRNYQTYLQAVSSRE